MVLGFGELVAGWFLLHRFLRPAVGWPWTAEIKAGTGGSGGSCELGRRPKRSPVAGLHGAERWLGRAREMKAQAGASERAEPISSWAVRFRHWAESREEHSKSFVIVFLFSEAY